MRARQDLDKVLKKKLSGEQNIYDHVVQVIDRIVRSCPDKAVERFEEISYLVKQHNQSRLESFVRCFDKRDYACHCKDMAQSTEASIEELRKLFTSSAPVADADGEEAAGSSGPVLGLVQDLTALNKHVFNQAGVELGEYGSLVLQKSLKQLGAQAEARSLRFWGKISGYENDYYIVEAFDPKNLPEDTRPEGGEARGVGVNEYTYYASNFAKGPWVALPDLNPEDLESARQIKVGFSGNLERAIVTNPFYFKQEKYYLRA